MNQTQALARLRKVLGPRMGYRVNPQALGAEQRAEASEWARELLTLKKAAEGARDARRAAILKADETYQSLKAEAARLEDEHAKAFSRAYQKRVTVGVSGNLFFTIRAEGDNWADVVAQVCKGERS